MRMGRRERAVIFFEELGGCWMKLKGRVLLCKSGVYMCVHVLTGKLIGHLNITRWRFRIVFEAW